MHAVPRLHTFHKGYSGNSSFPSPRPHLSRSGSEQHRKKRKAKYGKELREKMKSFAIAANVETRVQTGNIVRCISNAILPLVLEEIYLYAVQSVWVNGKRWQCWRQSTGKHTHTHNVQKRERKREEQNYGANRRIVEGNCAFGFWVGSITWDCSRLCTCRWDRLNDFVFFIAIREKKTIKRSGGVWLHVHDSDHGLNYEKWKPVDFMWQSTMETDLYV